MNRKKFFIILIFLIGIANLAFAQNDQLQKGKIEETKNEDTVISIVEKKINNKYAGITTRFQATIDRLNNIISRMETRITKIKAEGGDTAKAETAIANAKKLIGDAEKSMVDLKNSVISAGLVESTASTTDKELKDTLATLRKKANNTQKILVQAHLSLVKSIGFLKGLKVGQASTTPSTAQ